MSTPTPGLKPIVVIGMNRSGTSSVAGSLIKLGVHWGNESDFTAADANNQEGYWEHQGIVDVSLRFMMSLNLRYFESGPMPENWQDMPRSKRLMNEFAALIQKAFCGQELWGWKVPLTTVMMPFFKEGLDLIGMRPHFVLCVRNPLDVAASLAKRNQLPEHMSLGMWLRYTLAGLHGSVGETRTVLLFRDFLQDPRLSLKPIVEQHSGWDPTPENWEAACGHVRPELSHSQRPLEDLDRLPSIYRRTFALCEEAASDSAGLNAGKFDGRIEALWREMTTWMDCLREPDPPAGVVKLFSQSAGQVPVAEAAFPATRSWQKVQVAVQTSPGQPLLACLYEFPGSVWIRNVVWKIDGRAHPATFRPGPRGHIENEEGVQRLWVIHGPEQVLIDPPPGGGQAVLELELLVETNLKIVGQIYDRLVQELYGVSQHIARLEASQRR